MVVKPVHLCLFCLPAENTGGALFATSSDNEIWLRMGLVSGVKNIGDGFLCESGGRVGV